MSTASSNTAARLSARARRTPRPPISWLMQQAFEVPGMISLAAGFVDQRSLPATPVRELITEIYRDPDLVLRSLQYGLTGGLHDLRGAIAGRLERQGLPGPVNPDCVAVTSGSQQLLYLITEALVDPGDIVLVEDPTYFVYMGVLQSAGARTIGVATDDEGIVPEALEERLREIEAAGQLDRLKMLYVMTYFQNPKGTSHSRRRREQVYEIIERFSTPENFIHILEDAAYFELRFEGEELPFMKQLDTKNERVMLALTFSKGFAPGLRLGYGHLPEGLVEHVLNLKGNHDFGSGNFSQHIALEALRSGRFDDHVRALQDRYREKRDVMLRVIREEFPPEARFLEPAGGLYVWVTLPERVPTTPGSPFFNAAMEQRVLYVPGHYCYAQEEGRPKPENQMRLCYAYIDEAPMEEGLRRMAAAIKAAL